MSDIKWIKLSIDVFDDEKFDAIRTLPDSNDIQLVWIKLLCLAGKCNESGFLMLTSEIPYTDEMLAKKFGVEIGVIQRSLNIFQKLNMMDVIDNVYLVSNWNKYQSNDKLEDIREKNRERQRRFREKQKMLLEEKNEQKSNVTDNVKITQNCSYSYSFSLNNNNIKNLDIILNNNDYKYSIYILNNKDLYAEIRDWMEYKDTRTPRSRHRYSSEKGIKKMLTTIVEHDKTYGTAAVVKEIDKAIAGNWDGLHFESLDRYGKRIDDWKESKEQEEDNYGLQG